MIALCLPWPPSSNTYFRSLRAGPLAGRVIISEAGRDYRAAVVRSIQAQLGGVMPDLAGRLAVRIVARPPDKRRRDLDNMLKAVLDAITHAGAWRDDSQIDDLHITRGAITAGAGWLDLRISVMT